jgi:hypothetical protein
MGDACAFCGSTNGPFTKVTGLFDVLMCPGCQHDRGHRPGPYPAMTPEQMRASLDLLPTWVLAQKVGMLTVLAEARALWRVPFWWRFHDVGVGAACEQ